MLHDLSNRAATRRHTSPPRTGPGGTNDGMNVVCASCSEGLDHCHGTLLAHDDGSYECTDGSCAGPDPLRHGFVAGCEIVAGCPTCTEVPALAAAAA